MSDHPVLDRRHFLTAAATSLGALYACKAGATGATAGGEHLLARPITPTATLTPGQHQLGIATGRDGLLYVPARYSATVPLPLVVLLHGAGGTAANWFGSYGTRSDANNFVMLALDSREATWDAIRGEFGPDVRFIDQALKYTFARCAVDPRYIALAGFSDGASYALSLGLANGDLFSQVVAFSPGFFTPSTARGKPELFFSHGTQDNVLPIESTSRALVPSFRSQGYSVEFREFAGGHEVPAAISDQAMAWLQGKYHSA